MYKNPINPFDGIEPEQLEIEKSFASPLDREPFSEYSSLTYQNVPQPEGKVFRSNFDAKQFLQEKKIEELQQEYDRFINKINELNDNLQPLKLKNHNILNEYGKIEIELNKVNKEIENIETDFFILKNKYREEIKKKELKLRIRLLIILTIGGIIALTLMIMPLLINKLYFLIDTPIVLISYLITGSLFGFTHTLRSNKYLSKLEKEFTETEDYQNYQKQLDEKTKVKEEIEQKLDLKEKEVKESRKEINIIEYQIDILIGNIKRIRDELIDLILPDSKNIETKYQFSGTSLQEETKTTENNLVRRLTPQE